MAARGQGILKGSLYGPDNLRHWVVIEPGKPVPRDLEMPCKTVCATITYRNKDFSFGTEKIDWCQVCPPIPVPE
jgi:hypothetical protein